MDWRQRHVMITGGSSGIGKATARLVASRGAVVTIVGRDLDKLAGAKAEIEAEVGAAGPVLTISADLAECSEAERAIQTAVAERGGLDVLITSAGMAHPGYFRELPIEIFEQTMAVNYFGTLYCIKAALPSMRRGGKIVLISSGAGLIGLYGYTSYSPTKFALRGLAESLRGELKPEGIGVAIVYPPDTNTPQLEAENRTKPEETKRITATAEMWSAAGVAGAIVKGIEQGAFVIAPGQEMAILARLHSLIGPGLNWYFDRIVKQVRAAVNP
ncbi:MAG: SDR family oxidoreductase [Nodosilinea sp.]